MKLSDREWKEFEIQYLFNTYTGGDLIISTLVEGDIPVITHSSKNNGVQFYSTEILEQKLFDCEKTISLADRGTFYAAVQIVDFYIGTRVKALEAKFTYCNSSILTFIAIVINQESFRYQYGRNCTSGIDTVLLKLPVNSDGEPDYQFMEDYIKSLDVDVFDVPDYFKNDGYDKACWYLDNIDVAKFEQEYAGVKQSASIKLSDREWKDFYLFDVFEIDTGNKFDRSKMTKIAPTVNFVGRTANNNGCVDYVDEVDDIKPYPAGNLTLALGGSIGSCFYQEQPFYTSQNVDVLIPKWNMSKYVLNFIITSIRFESVNKYVAFARELNAHVKVDFTFKLPVDNAGNPDWQFMEDYIKSLPFSAKL